MKNLSRSTATLAAATIGTAALLLVLLTGAGSEVGGARAADPASPRLTREVKDAETLIATSEPVPRTVAVEVRAPALEDDAVPSVRTRAQRLARLTQGESVDPPATPEELRLVGQLRQLREGGVR